MQRRPALLQLELALATLPPLPLPPPGCAAGCAAQVSPGRKDIRTVGNPSCFTSFAQSERHLLNVTLLG